MLYFEAPDPVLQKSKSWCHLTATLGDLDIPRACSLQKGA